MTVKELIEALNKIENKELEVCTLGDDLIWANLKGVQIIVSESKEEMWVYLEEV